MTNLRGTSKILLSESTSEAYKGSFIASVPSGKMSIADALETKLSTYSAEFDMLETNLKNTMAKPATITNGGEFLIKRLAELYQQKYDTPMALIQNSDGVLELYAIEKEEKIAGKICWRLG